MAKLILTRLKDQKIKDDVIRVNQSKGHVNGNMFIARFTDKDTKQIVLFAPSLNITSYGSTADKAFEMLKVSIQDLFNHFLSLSRKDLETELRSMGWKKALLKNKEFSKMAVNADGGLDNLNAFEDKVERFALVA